MTTTESELEALLARVNQATKSLQRSAYVPSEVAQLVDRFEAALGAATPLRLEADPYLTTTLWAAAFRAEKALRHDNEEEKRRDVRMALEQFRHALRDIVERRPYDDGAPVRDVLIKTAEAVGVPQKELAELLGVSDSQTPALALARRARGPPQTTPPAFEQSEMSSISCGTRSPVRESWPGSTREHPTLRGRPIEYARRPIALPELLGAATADARHDRMSFTVFRHCGL